MALKLTFFLLAAFIAVMIIRESEAQQFRGHQIQGSYVNYGYRLTANFPNGKKMVQKGYVRLQPKFYGMFIDEIDKWIDQGATSVTVDREVVSGNSGILISENGLKSLGG